MSSATENDGSFGTSFTDLLRHRRFNSSSSHRTRFRYDAASSEDNSDSIIGRDTLHASVAQDEDEDLFVGKGKGKGKAASYVNIDDPERPAQSPEIPSSSLKLKDHALVLQFSGPTRRAAELLLDWRDVVDGWALLVESRDSDDSRTAVLHLDEDVEMLPYEDPLDYRQQHWSPREYQDISDADTAVDPMSIDDAKSVASIDYAVGNAYAVEEQLDASNLTDTVPVLPVSLSTNDGDTEFGRNWLLRRC
ncbi:hypothetical protein M427DRAFT_72334, partial [Gonapodya prolifera JEL478]